MVKLPQYVSQSRNSQRDKLKLWVPDTIILNDAKPTWIYTTIDGYVNQIDEFHDKHILSKLENRDRLNEVVIVHK